MLDQALCAQHPPNHTTEMMQRFHIVTLYVETRIPDIHRAAARWLRSTLTAAEKHELSLSGCNTAEHTVEDSDELFEPARTDCETAEDTAEDSDELFEAERTETFNDRADLV